MIWRSLPVRLSCSLPGACGLIALGLLTLLLFCGPWFSPYEIDQIFWDDIAAAPALANGHYFGTDANGRDLFVRSLAGGRVSMAVALAASAISLVIGVSWGAVAGYCGGAVDLIMMRIVDILYSLPFIFFVILLTVGLGRSLDTIFIAIGAVVWLDMARIVRGQTMSLKTRSFVEAARAFGAGDARILLRHILPNLTGPIIVCLLLVIPDAILTESFLSFLGLGVQEPMTSWGALVGDGAQTLAESPWSLLFPGGLLVLTILALNFFGDGLRDCLDSRSDH